MRNVMKAATLESKFPILSVEHDCIISKDADITVCYRVELPELFTVTQAEYEAIHSAWAKAVKVLPNFSIVHKQDFFIEESYTPELQKEDLSFLSRSFERHFNERPYLKHTCYLFLTKTTKEHSRTTSSFNALIRGFIIPKETFTVETMPVPKRLVQGETAEIRCEIVREGYFSDTRYTIRYFQPDGEGTLRMDDGMVLLPNDRYPLDRDVFRLYYTSECEDQQTIDVYFEDNHDQLYQLTFTFNNEAKEEEDTTEGNTITPIGTIVSPINFNP